jgi:putative lipase involved disintegration of autophagic bodies
LLEPDIIKHIQEFHEKGQLVDSVLFTGHSLGGAIAQILYFFAFTKGLPLYEALAGECVNLYNFFLAKRV